MKQLSLNCTWNILPYIQSTNFQTKKVDFNHSSNNIVMYPSALEWSMWTYCT